jgi:hypothetical protein
VLKSYFASIISEKGRIRTRIRTYLLMDPDPDPGGPKTCGSCRSGSGSPTLAVNQSFKPKITSVTVVDQAEILYKTKVEIQKVAKIQRIPITRRVSCRKSIRTYT